MTVGMVPRTWRANDFDLTASTVETRESTTRDSFVVFSMVMALALPRTTMVVLMHLEMRMECEMSTWISIGPEGWSKFSYAPEG
jgi:hypothetical protein